MENILVSNRKDHSELSLEYEQFFNILTEVCGDGSDIIYEENIPKCAKYISSGQVAGLIITRGHGDWSTIRNLKDHLRGEIPIPIFEAYDPRMNQSTKYNSVRNWLKNDVLKE